MAEQKASPGQRRRVNGAYLQYIVCGTVDGDPDEYYVVELWEEDQVRVRFRTREAIELDVLMRDPKSKPVERMNIKLAEAPPPKPVEPLQARTEAGVIKDGWVSMRVPSVVLNPKTHLAQQGAGHAGWTCVGFSFEEAPDGVYPQSQGWVDPGAVVHHEVQMIRHGSYTKRVIATTAIWENES